MIRGSLYTAVVNADVLLKLRKRVLDSEGESVFRESGHLRLVVVQYFLLTFAGEEDTALHGPEGK